MLFNKISVFCETLLGGNKYSIYTYSYRQVFFFIFWNNSFTIPFLKIDKGWAWKRTFIFIDQWNALRNYPSQLNFITSNSIHIIEIFYHEIFELLLLIWKINAIWYLLYYSFHKKCWFWYQKQKCIISNSEHKSVNG